LITAMAASPPTICATMNAGTDAGAMPAKLSENIRPMVMAGLAKLADEDNIVGTKDSDSNMKGFIEYCDATENKEFGVMTGSDALLLASLMAGASGGIIASAGVVPQFSAALYEKFQKGDIAGAKAEQDKITKFVGSMFSLGTFPQGAKEALRLLGVEVGNAFRPIKPFNDEQLGKLKATMKEFGLI